MNNALIYWPMLAVLAIPIWVLLLNGKRKKVDRAAGDLNENAAIDNKAWSLPVILTSNALANQFSAAGGFLCAVFYISAD